MTHQSTMVGGRRAILPRWLPVRPPARLSAALRRMRYREDSLAGPADVKWCYRLLLGREPDDHGLRGFVSLVTDNPVPRAELASLFLSSPEFRDRLAAAHHWAGAAPIGTRVDDLMIYVHPGDVAIGSFLRKSGAYEPDVTAVIRRQLATGASFVDVGASFGYFSVLAGRIVGRTGCVISVEPGPQNQSLLLMNLAANKIPTAEVHQLALSDSTGICRYGQSGANGTIAPFDGDPGTLGTYDLVRASTLDLVLAGRSIDMVKIDVEGAEGRVIRGAEETLRRCSPAIVFEFSPPSLEVTSGMTGEELLRGLTSLGYVFDLVRADAGSVRPRSSREILRLFGESDGDHINLLAWRS